MKNTNKKPLADIIFEHTKSPYIIRAISGKILKINKAGCDFLGDTKENILGKYLWNYYENKEDSDKAKISFNEGIKKKNLSSNAFFGTYSNNKRGNHYDQIVIDGNDITVHTTIDDLTKELLDAKTGLYNLGIISKIKNETKEKKQYVDIIKLDLDKLKELNDIYGHQTGDKAICDFAGFLKDSVKKSTDYAVRTGGDEFTIYLTHSGSIDKEKREKIIIKVILRIKHKVDNYNKKCPLPTKLLYSVGYAFGDSNIDYTYKIADKNMYENKRLNKNLRNLGTLGRIGHTIKKYIFNKANYSNINK